MSDTSHYILKKGARHSHIINGEPVEFVGDGEATLELSDAQAEAFKDKLVGKSDAPVEFKAPEPVFDAVAGNDDEGKEEVKEGEKPAPAPAKK